MSLAAIDKEERAHKMQIISTTSRTIISGLGAADDILRTVKRTRLYWNFVNLGIT